MTNCRLHPLFKCIDRINESMVSKDFRSVSGCGHQSGSLWVKIDINYTSDTQLNRMYYNIKMV